MMKPITVKNLREDLPREIAGVLSHLDLSHAKFWRSVIDRSEETPDGGYLTGYVVQVNGCFLRWENSNTGGFILTEIKRAIEKLEPQ